MFSINVSQFVLYSLLIPSHGGELGDGVQDVEDLGDETAWWPMTKVFELIEKAMPELKVWYMAEEEGLEIYETH